MGAERVVAALLTAVIVVGCIGGEDDQGVMPAGSVDGPSPGTAGTGSVDQTEVGMAGAMSLPMPMAGMEAMAGAGPIPMAGMDAMGMAGMGSGESGQGGEAGTGAAAQVPPGAIEPIIPQMSGACPEFRTGTATIMGLSTSIVAGTPGATKGPLLFAWHGTGGTGSGALRQVPPSVQSDIMAKGGIIIAPSSNGMARGGTDVTLILNVWYDGGDLAFADQVVACAVQNHNIDPRQIYATGCSAGGLMAGVMSLLRSSYVAAAAPNSGGTVVPGYMLQDAMRVPAVMTLHGGTGDNVIVNFADTSRNLINTLRPAGAFLVDCNHMAGHCRASVELHERAWDFMKAHPFGIGTSPYEGGLPANFPSYCQIQ
jgi:predicted esterase